MAEQERDWEDYLADPILNGRVLSDHALVFRYEACARYLRENGELDLYARNRGNFLDYKPFRFGQLYRCIRDFQANDLDRISRDFCKARAGETMWFTGWSSHAYDGLVALFFCDLNTAKEFVFTDCRPEIDGRINRAFKDAPADYFEEMADMSEYSAVLMDLRAELMRRHELAASERVHGLPD
ncbi:hypothetical protein J2T09_003099 [Neorhizobium huautlense]|uniref:Uncharacterized protein n=1 Tax=Neorhizobium huautlense TaxID=67774 RepID=A0ABT9PV38_9HYPH|nr:hypothetical protein [Neorhizobium huautlense]MDP9838332.1 hypothetical protein [Neorhizobium huautlense]